MRNRISQEPVVLSQVLYYVDLYVHLYIISLRPYNNLWDGYYYLHFVCEEAEPQRGRIRVRARCGPAGSNSRVRACPRPRVLCGPPLREACGIRLEEWGAEPGSEPGDTASAEWDTPHVPEPSSARPPVSLACPGAFWRDQAPGRRLL